MREPSLFDPTPSDATAHDPSPYDASTDGTRVPAFDPLGDLPRGTVLLEASAGTGKTYSIASLVLRLVAEERLGIHEILVVTFTEAATTELRDRVRRRIRDAHAAAQSALGDGGEPARPRAGDVTAHVIRHAWERGALAQLVDDLRRALERFDDAPITTIHGFCARVLRERAFECGAELDGELLADPAELVDEVVRDFWARETAARPLPLVRALVEQERLGLAVLGDLARKALAHPDAPCAPDAQDVADVAAAMTERARLAREVADAWRSDEVNDALALVEEAREAKRLSGVSWKADWLERRGRPVSAWAAADPESAALPKELACFASDDLKRTANKGKAPPEHGLFDAVQALVDADRALADVVQHAALHLRHECVAWVRAEVARRKRERRQHGFDDLLHLLRDALRRDAEGRDGGTLAAALRATFRAALIDEFQDTDAVQWEIFRRAFGGPDHRLLLIGDPKQAIYGFRGADVHAYLDAREAAARTWALDRNWRTDRPLVDALEALFARGETPFAEPGIAWRPVQAQHAAARLVGDGDAALRVRFLSRDGVLASALSGRTPREGAPLLAKGKLGQLLPDLVAADVVRFLRSGARIVEERGGRRVERAVRPSDAAILVRSNRQARAVQAALRHVGVPAVVHGAESVFASVEARELATVLAAVLEPADQRLARAALATDLLGLPAAAELGIAGGPGDALAALDAGDGWDAWSERLRWWRAAWRGDGREWRGAVRGAASPMRLVRALLDELRLPERLLALDDGERRLTNLLHVAELLHAEAVAGALEPGATLAWLRDQIAQGSAPGDDERRQVRLESDDDAAQVVTVHSSKGLEYPAVWCPYLWDGDLARDADKRHPCVHEERDGALVRTLHLLAPKGHASHARLDDDAFAESLRLAYVALTRARHRVTLWWGAVNDFETSPLAWLLHGDACVAPRDARERLAATVKRLGDDALRAALVEVATRAAGRVAVEDERPEVVARWTADDADAPALDARPWTRAAPLDDGWRVGSFTALTRGGAHGARDADDAAPVDAPEALGDARAAGDVRVDAATDETTDETTDATTDAPRADDARVPLADFPSSAAAGICFHEILERHDFPARDALRPLVDDRLDAYGFGAAAWGAPITDALQAMLDAPLPSRDGGAPLRLGAVTRADRLVELRFELPAADGARHVTPAALARVFREHPGGALDDATLARYADRVQALGFRPLRGFLGGAIDLVVRHDGRWWIADYKSNRLGVTRADYAAARMQAEMTDAHYVLQYHLYALALHRWLALRVPGYDWDRDVGGVLYLFLRGIGDGTGVFVDRPPRARIEALDRLFREGA